MQGKSLRPAFKIEPLISDLVVFENSDETFLEKKNRVKKTTQGTSKLHVSLKELSTSELAG